MNIYIVRHGTTVWNQKGISQGHSQNRLSESGKQLVIQTANKHKDTKFDIIFCSPLMRTIQTANIINKFHNVKIIKDRRIIEIDQGIFTGRKVSTLTEQERQQKKLRSKSCKMESWQSVHNRAKLFLEDILQNCQFENILIVTHSYVATCLENIIVGKKVDYSNYIDKPNFANAELRKYVLSKI